MEWLDRLNESLKYIEDNLDGKINYEEAAKIACCSIYHFQRMFSYIAGVPLAEYIRNRRMTLAALDLQRGAKVIDVAMKYGYDSPTAFNRAFHKIHHISPSMAQKEGTFLKAFAPISFKITVHGVNEMEYSIVKKEKFTVVGAKVPLSRNIDENFRTVPEFWHDVEETGKIKEILSLADKKINGVFGLSACMDSMEQWEYYIGVESSRRIPQDMSEFIVEAGTWAVFKGQGPMPQSIQNVEKQIMTEWFPNSGYKYGNGPDIELYLNADPSNSLFEVWVPIEEKK